MEHIDELVRAIEEHRLLEYTSRGVEFKRSWQQDYGKKISFLANKSLAESCWVVLGIEDDGTPSCRDQNWAKSTEEAVSQHLNQYLDPIQCVLALTCRALSTGEWMVIIQICSPGTVVRWNGKAFKGAGTTLLEMTPEEVMELTVSLPGLSDHSAQRAKPTFDPDLVRTFAKEVESRQGSVLFAQLSTQEPGAILDRMRIAGTNAARILFGDVGYRIVAFDSRDEPVRNETRFGLFSVLTASGTQEILNTINSLSPKKLRIPLRAIKEGLANAVAHAAYFDSSGDILIEIHPNRIVVSNLCLPESGYFANKWFSRSRRTVNNLLMETLRVCGYVDELGRGKNLIYSESLKSGNLPPEVVVEAAGRFSRWRLFIYFESLAKEHVMMLERLRTIYTEEYKAQIANALVLWRDKKVSEIKKYIDGESFPLFQNILADFDGPVFYYEQDDRLLLRRWARLIIEKGHSSGRFTPAEEQSFLQFAYDFCTKFRESLLTSKDFRWLAHMGSTPSEITLGSSILTKWTKAGIVEKLKKGVYKFVKVPESQSVEHNLEILKSRLLSGRPSE